jgi:ATP-binding cassette subfamily B protein
LTKAASRGGGLRAITQDPTQARSRDFKTSAVRLIRRLLPHRRLAVAVVMLTVLGIGLTVAGPRILGHATDLLFNGVLGRQLPVGLTKEQAVEAARAHGDNTFADLLSRADVIPGHGIDFNAVARTLLLALGMYSVGALVVWSQARLLNLIVQRTVTALRAEVETKVHRLPLRYFDSRPRGELLSRVTNDVDNIQSSISMTISQLLTSVLSVVAVLVMMLTISPLLTLITVLTVPLSLWATRVIARRSQGLFAAQWERTGQLNAHVEETYSGFTLVRTYGHRTVALDKFHQLNDEVYDASFGAQFVSGLVSPATTLVGNFSYVLVAVVGGYRVATGQITLGGIQAFIQYVRQFNQPLTQVAGMYNALQSGIASAERVFEFLDEPEEPGCPEGRLEQPCGRSSAARVEFRNVSFGYRPESSVLTDISFVAEPGSTTAIVGRTGVGKTTLVNLMMRFYELDAGQILVDGVDITTLSRHALRSRVGMVLQDAWLFNGTIAENIEFGRPGATHAEVIEAARAAHVDQFVRTLPNGYETRIGTGGGGISAGERQLITIARAFLARPQILILDEATSSVDTRTELLIQQAMTTLRRERTSFIVAHRLSTVRHADTIIVLADGRIVEKGSHSQLLERCGSYYEMLRRQGQ